MKMKKALSLLMSLTVLLASVNSYAECKWADGIKKAEGGFLYSNDCHKRVGKIVQDLEDREVEVVNLRKGLELKDLALQKSDERIMLWRNESYEQYDRMMRQSELANRNQYLWFVLGIVVTGAAVHGAGQLR